ncbi:hypothetical protein A7U60_g4991 [Sanghuangporus baumii]|uniref:Lipid droplet-associated hydrolase n=1 Tax=Sanghuangporus baumii TaxID=108892 RepID=A0A9Q5N494_SANBA|nr:hypothetical protein A7U60_g4991 [Sanghuangporus baumii]
MIPPFLKSISFPTTDPAELDACPVALEYMHSERLGRSVAHCLWWPCKDKSINPNTVLLFVPGNPGLADFYRSYLSHIYEAAPDYLAILAHSLVGHSPFVPPVPLHVSRLESQIEAMIETIDVILGTFGSAVKLVLIGHSVARLPGLNMHMSLLFKTLSERPNCVTAAFLLFPTITHIVHTPNGSRLSWLFNGFMPSILSHLSKVFRVIPKSILRLLFRDWPPEQIEVLWSFLNCPSAILATLKMAHQEMDTIKDLDKELFNSVKHKLYLFFAEKDDWVGDNKDMVLREMSDEPHSIRIIHGRHDIPHAYCINHGKELGEQTLKWLQDDVFGLAAGTAGREVRHIK